MNKKNIKKTSKSLSPEKPEPKLKDKSTDMKSLLEKNIKWSQVIFQQNKKIKRRLTMLVVGNYLRLFLILAPIIIGIIYLVPFVSDIIGEYRNILSLIGSGTFDNKTISEILQGLSNGDFAPVPQ